MALLSKLDLMFINLDPNAPQAVPIPDLSQDKLQEALAAVKAQQEAFKHPAQRTAQQVRIVPSSRGSSDGGSVHDAQSIFMPQGQQLPPAGNNNVVHGIYVPQSQAGSSDLGAQSSLGRGVSSHDLSRPTSGQDISPQYLYESDKSDKSSTLSAPQEVTQYCPHTPCEWASYRTYDPAHLRSCIDQLVVHIGAEHGDGDMTAVGRPRSANKGSMEYKAATKPRTVSKVTDDACQNLCEARYWSFPMDIKTAGLNMPVSASPVVTSLDLSYVGVEVSAAEIVKRVHDRSTVTLRLRDFSDSNLRSYQAPGDALVAIGTSQSQLHLGRSYKDLEGTKVCEYMTISL